MLVKQIQMQYRYVGLFGLTKTDIYILMWYYCFFSSG